MLTDRYATRAHRRSARSLLQSSYDQLIDGIANGRGLTTAQVPSRQATSLPCPPLSLKAIMGANTQCR